MEIIDICERNTVEMKKIRLIVIIYLMSILLISCSKNMSEKTSNIEKNISDIEEKMSNIEEKMRNIEEGITGIKEDINGKQDETEESEESSSRNKKAYYYFVVPGEKEFHDLILNNPIDEDTGFFVDSGLVATLTDINEKLEYCTLWEAEIDAALQQLEELLSMGDYQKLLESHEAWESYMDSVFLLELSMFNPTTEYTISKNGSSPYPIGGSMTFMLTAWVNAQRTRAHAIEILSYVYALTGEINYVYQSK